MPAAVLIAKRKNATGSLPTERWHKHYPRGLSCPLQPLTRAHSIVHPFVFICCCQWSRPALCGRASNLHTWAGCFYSTGKDNNPASTAEIAVGRLLQGDERSGALSSCQSVVLRHRKHGYFVGICLITPNQSFSCVVNTVYATRGVGGGDGTSNDPALGRQMA